MSTSFVGEGNIGFAPDYREFPNGDRKPGRLQRLNGNFDKAVPRRDGEAGRRTFQSPVLCTAMPRHTVPARHAGLRRRSWCRRERYRIQLPGGCSTPAVHQCAIARDRFPAIDWLPSALPRQACGPLAGRKQSTHASPVVPSTVINRRPCRPAFLSPVSFGAVMLSLIRRTAHRQGGFIVGSRDRG